MNYYDQPYCSNSLLTRLKIELETPELLRDYTAAFGFGSLVDALITEPHRVDHIRFCLLPDRPGNPETFYSVEEMSKAKKMRDAYFADPYIQATRKAVAGQQEFYADELPLHYQGTDFKLPFRCKFDEWLPGVGYGHEIKTTACTTQAAFDATIQEYGYDRAAYLYLSVTCASRYVLYGISKKAPHKLFRSFITPDSPLYASGKEKASELAWKYWMLKHTA